MRFLLILSTAIVLFSSCSNSSSTAKTFCDTACQSDSLIFVGESDLKPTVAVSFKNCEPDSLTWHHYLMDFSKNVDLRSFLGQSIRMNPAMVNCYIQDTSYAWLTFNDCITGRGYTLKLPFAENGTIGKYTGALNDFDPKYSVDPDLRAYTDRGTIFVENIKTGKQAAMSFKEAYDIDFNKLHEVVDSVNVTKNRIYVKLLKEGKEVPIEKQVEL